jgi:lipopolysaccharide transport system ATP-binding protein
MMRGMIVAEQIGKRFMLYDRAIDRALDWLRPAARRRGRPFWALRDVSFEVAGGAAMGIVGPNGAGKSTLLKILTGTTQPTEGRFCVQGRVASLLELGMGFHPEFTGRQNVRFAARMAGIVDDELEALFPEIVDFSELDEFIDQPIRAYSSGMLLRLGFALAVSVQPDVLIVDEALAVGDLHFQQKCLARIRRIHEAGATVLFVSHDPSMVKRFCTEAILLDHGRALDRGTPSHVLDHYTALLAERYRPGGGRARILRPVGPEAKAPETTPPGGAVQAAPASVAEGVAKSPSSMPPLAARGHRTGNWRAVIIGAWLEVEPEGDAGTWVPSGIVGSGAWARLVVRWVAREPIASATVGIAIKDRLGQEIYGVNTAYRGIPLENVAAGRAVQVAFVMPMNLGEGLYSATVAVHAGLTHVEECYDWIEQALVFQVLPDPGERFTGICRLGAECEIQAEAATAEDLERANGHGAPQMTTVAPAPLSASGGPTEAPSS